MNPTALSSRLPFLVCLALPVSALGCGPDLVPERQLGEDEMMSLVDGCTGRPPRRCSEYTLRFDPTPIEDPVVLAACLTYAEHERACGRSYDDADCHLYSRIQRVSAYRSYDCMASLQCDENASACFTPGPLMGLVSICDHPLRNRPCFAEEYELLAVSDGWLRDDVVALLVECWDRGPRVQTEPDGEACTFQWLEAIRPPSRR